MRVVLVVRALPVHRFGGLEYHTFDLANALQQQGCAVTIITSRHPDGRDREVLESGVEVVYLRKGHPGDYSLSFFQGVEEAVEALDGKVRFDVVHAQEFAGLLMKSRPKRFVMTVHGTMTTETPLDRRYLSRLRVSDRVRELWRGKGRLALIPLFQRCLHRADRLIVDSHFTRRELLRMNALLGDKIAVVPLGLDFSRYRLPVSRPPEHHDGRLKILMLGRAQVMRGLLEALASVYRLRWHGIPFQMVIGGAETPPGWVDSAIAHFLLQDHVSYVGRVPQEEVSELFSWADLFLFSDRTQPAFGLACVEAMLHGVPVLATRVGAVPEVVTDDAGWLCEPWDSQDMTTQLVRIATFPAERQKKSEYAWHYARQFTAEAMARRVLEVYRSLTAEQ